MDSEKMPMTGKNIFKSIIFLIVLAVFGTMVFVCVKEYSRIYVPSYWGYAEISDVTKEQSVMISDEGNGIYKLHLKFSNHLTGEAVLYVSNKRGGKEYEVELKGGKNNRFINDWYQEKCFITYQPTTAVSGSVGISYSFLGGSAKFKTVKDE